MTKRILVDAVHPEEIRVAVADDSKLVEFEFESNNKKQIKSNIYLGKITRVEPSLQAAFVEYGGNRQGFLPFSEIHFDYFQIPVEDKEKLSQIIGGPVNPDIDSDEDDDDEDGNTDGNGGKAELTEEEKQAEELAKEFALELMGEDYVAEKFSEAEVEVETEEAEDEIEERPISRVDFYKKYKIQEVIKRNQVVLVQIIKEERGNKGASLSTYLALAGRCCVFMPNTERGGGVSRRITNFSERKRIKQVLKSLEIPKGNSVIIRTAGMEKEGDEIKADYNYLASVWDNIRNETLESKAPSLIYEESDITRRSIRDLFKGDVKEIYIEGDDAYKSAKKFIEIISPDQLSKLHHHKAKMPLFQKFKIEEKLDELYEPEVKLESGGSIVIAPTEALVAIDVNSGKATKERNVEDTALNTNLEAAREISRQLKLRDLAGLIVIDFIDMRDVKNRKAIEKQLKDALKNDRAKIQVGRISTFGLLEMSRQRMHSSLIESSSVVCPMCKGIGDIRSNDSSLMKIIREVESLSRKKNVNEINIKLSKKLADSLKRERIKDIKQIETDANVAINIIEDISMLPNQFDILTNKPNKSNKPQKKQGEAKNTKKKPYNKRNNKQDSEGNNGNVTEITDASDKKDKGAKEEKEASSERQSSKLLGLWKKITS